MTKFTTALLGAAILLCGSAHMSLAEDIDIFGTGPGVTVGAPNILFILDNSANWSRNSQQWPDMYQGQAELLAIRKLVTNLDKPANVGLMMLTERGNIGGYVRFGMRSMLQGGDNSPPSTANTALGEILLAISGDVDDPNEKVPQSKDNYTNAMYETWLYLTGSPSWAGEPGTNNPGRAADKRDFQGNTATRTAAERGLTSLFAYQGSERYARYNSPSGGDACARTYIVFIGNNRASEQGGMPAVPGPNAPSVTKLTQYGYAPPPGGFLVATWAQFLRNRPDLGPPGSAAAANGAVITYTIDAYNAQSNPTYTSMMETMANAGGGKYFKANTNEELETNLEFIVNEIQAVNSVFAAVTLPVSVNQRGTFLNQVYLGVFRPDAAAKPNWPGNLKQYKIAANTATDPTTLFLADKNGAPATSAVTGFISPNATSYWTASSSFWAPLYYGDTQGVGGASDAPDGDLVEKGGVAQGLRTTYASSQAARNVYTCTGACTGNSLLSSTPFATANTDVGLSADIINWVRGANNQTDDNPSAISTDVRGRLHGDVLHSRPAVVNYNRSADDVYVFYGANDGMLRAVKGGQGDYAVDGPGSETWAFVAPEHFGQLQRLRDHSPPISAANRKPYFIDGSPTVFTHDVDNDGEINATDGDKAYLFLSMRRGGRFIYALDISDPTAPRMLWKRSNADSGFGEMGLTWSDLRVAKIRASSDPVLIFGLGYDADANDSVVATAGTMGRGVMVVNAVTGAKIWASSDAGDRHGIDYSIPASVAQVDSDADTLVDRIIAADTGGNIWRMNIDDASTTNWTVDKVAALRTDSGDNARRFINTPDVVLAGPDGASYDTILIGSGDREQPFDEDILNRFYMIKDSHVKDYRWSTPVTEAGLYDATGNLIQDGTTDERAAASVALAGAQGWYIRLGDGEKVDGPSTTLSNTTFFGTNTPADNTTDICISNLGTARAYALSYLDASASVNLTQDQSLNSADRSQVIPGGGFPPPPVAIQVEIDGQIYQAIAFGTQILQPPGGTYGRRFRQWWYQSIDP